MIPYSDNVARRNNTRIAVIVLILINIVIFIYELIQISNNQAEFLRFALTNQSSFFTAITYQFLHGGWVHLIGNMLYLWVFGRTIEDYIGSFRFLLLFLVSGVFGGLAQTFWFDANTPIIGASASIAGVMGAYAVWFNRAQVKAILPIFFFWTSITLPVLVTLGLWLVTNLFNGYASIIDQSSGGVAYISHIVGFIFGVLIALALPLMHKPIYLNS